MQQDITVPGHPEPGPDNFSFEDYLEGISTFPVFKHTAYLDQRSGAELAAVLNEIDELIEEQTRIEKRIELRTQQAVNSFVDATLDGLTEERSSVEDRLGKLDQRANVLRKKIQSSSLVLTFQVKTPEELGNVTREATRKFHRENQQYKNASEDDLDYMTARTRFMLTAQIAHFCTDVTLPDGRTVASPTQSQAELLLSKLISSEMMRLMESVATGLSASQEWADKLDAGFPGGGADMEDVELGAHGAEDGEVVGPSTHDDADGKVVGLV
jgi:hypothetical protein